MDCYEDGKNSTTPGLAPLFGLGVSSFGKCCSSSGRNIAVAMCDTLDWQAKSGKTVTEDRRVLSSGLKTCPAGRDRSN